MTSQRTRVRMIERLREQGIADEAVLDVMDEVPRHMFVEEALASRAYEDIALPLGFGQTISQPYIVARMTELLRAGAPARQGARDRHRLRLPDGDAGADCDGSVFGRAAAPLLAKARKNLRELRITNVRLKHADGHVGIARRPRRSTRSS